MFSERHAFILLMCLISLLTSFRYGSTTRVFRVVDEGAAAEDIDQFKGKLRLPKFAVPKRYEIRLKPDIEAFTFSGSVKIQLDIVSDTAFLVLNAVALNITPSSIFFMHSNYSQMLKPKNVEIVPEDEILVLQFDKSLPVGVGVLAMDFKGLLQRSSGFFWSTNGANKTMLATQFESVSARRCFPFWDEPALKATFKMLLDVPAGLMALSNMPVTEEKVVGDLRTVTFQESPPMTTYLVAVAVGLFDFIESYTADGTRVRLYCSTGRSNGGKFALEVAVRALNLYTEFFGIPYALPKLDMISIPGFGGAMENFGLVTFQEQLLLYDEQHPTTDSNQYLLSAVAIEHLFPEWDGDIRFVGSFSRVLRLDALQTSHPIEIEINQTIDIHRAFDPVTYDKGAAVLRMVQDYLGFPVLKRSLTAYLRKYGWSSANTDDLWRVLEEVSGKPVIRVMSAWTKQKGYPLISVEARNQILKFEQSQFLLGGSQGGEQWTVPITLCCGSYGACHSFLLVGKSMNLDTKKLSGCSCMEDIRKTNESSAESKICPWIEINVNQTGFYRVKYDEGLAAKLGYAIKEKHLSATDRYGILDDAYAVSEASQLHLTSLLSYMDSYREEEDYIVQSNLMTISNGVARIVVDSTPELLGCFKSFFIGLIKNYPAKLGWEPRKGESDLAMASRSGIVSSLAILGDHATQTEATRRFHSFLDNRNTSLVSWSMRKATFVAVMQHVNTFNRSDYEALRRVYRETIEEQTDILGALPTCPEPRIVLEVLDFLLSSEVQLDYVFYGLDVSQGGCEAAWSWMKEKWDYLSERWTSGILAYAITKFVSPFASYEKRNEVEEFFGRHNITDPFMVRSLNESLQQVVINANWVRSIQAEKNLGEALKSFTQGNC